MYQQLKKIKHRNNFHLTLLFLCGFSILFWELILIRWLGMNIRIVAYFTNFTLIAAFFGLGLGALLARFKWTLDKWLPLLLSVVVLSVLFSNILDFNIGGESEYIWEGAPKGVINIQDVEKTDVRNQISPELRMFALASLYIIVAGVFAIFGQILGVLFKGVDPIKGYSAEIAGSLAGIGVFFALSYFAISPTVWFIIGFISIIPLIRQVWSSYIAASLFGLIVVLGTYPIVDSHIWSPYYKIDLKPLTGIYSQEDSKWHDFDRVVGHQVTVNNDFHQMMLNLGDNSLDHEFISDWRKLYDYPYRDEKELPDGPILIIGAGTGNDVAAALRRTNRRIVAVEIDPSIQFIGSEVHPERPYDNKRVEVVHDDARSFLTNTNEKFSMVVFGFLDSHTLLSSYSSLRLDNFVYTKESLEQVKKLLLPGGKTSLTFTVNKSWLHMRFLKTLSEVFGNDPMHTIGRAYVNGVVYENYSIADNPAEDLSYAGLEVKVPTDNWPFLYLKDVEIPSHYAAFMVIVVILGFLSLSFLPKGQRSIRFPYFFLGAAFFLLETSNVVTLSLLFGSTWTVNALVFSGILLLILAGNFSAITLKNISLRMLFVMLIASLLVSYFVPTEVLLSIESVFLRGLSAILIYLGPIYFAALAFALLIKYEKYMFQAYGSNLLGAVIGGASEYMSLV
jgi:SAM-dependent methyltransferase